MSDDLLRVMLWNFKPSSLMIQSNWVYCFHYGVKFEYDWYIYMFVNPFHTHPIIHLEVCFHMMYLYRKNKVSIMGTTYNFRHFCAFLYNFFYITQSYNNFNVAIYNPLWFHWDDQWQHIYHHRYRSVGSSCGRRFGCHHGAA